MELLWEIAQEKQQAKKIRGHRKYTPMHTSKCLSFPGVNVIDTYNIFAVFRYLTLLWVHISKLNQLYDTHTFFGCGLTPSIHFESEFLTNNTENTLFIVSASLLPSSIKRIQ